MSNIKLERISSSILRELSSIIYEEVHNQVVKSITITDVRVTIDLSLSKVYYTFYGDYEKNEVQEELARAASFLRTELAKRIKIRSIPEIRFVYDESTEYGEHIEQIIEEIHNESRE